MASKNVVLVDKQKNQIAPATVAEQVALDGSNVKSVIHNMLLKTSLYGITITTLTKTVTVTETYGNIRATATFSMDDYEDYQILDFYWVVDPTRLNNDIFCFENQVYNQVELSFTNPQYPVQAGNEVTFGLVIAYDADVDNAELTDIRLGADEVTYDTAGEAVRTQLNEKVPFPLDDGDPDYGEEGQVLITNGDGTTQWGIGGGGSGVLWDSTDVNLFRQVLSRLKYDSAEAGTIAESLLTSLENKPSDEGWSRAQVDLLDSLLSHVKYTDDDGGEYADQLIASLKGIVPTYEDADEVEY